MTDRRASGLLGPGAVLTAAGLLALVGAGLVAIEQSSVSSVGNSLTAGVIEVEGDGLVIARTDDPASCPDATWGPGPIAALLLDRVDVADPDWQQDGPVVCLRNDADRLLGLHVVAVNTTDIELGTCEDGEVTAGDTTCADGDAGELGAAVWLSWDALGPPGQSACTSTGRSFWDHVTEQVVLGALAPGATCALRLRASLDQDERVRARAQSDLLQWDLVLTGTP